MVACQPEFKGGLPPPHYGVHVFCSTVNTDCPLPPPTSQQQPLSVLLLPGNSQPFLMLERLCAACCTLHRGWSGGSGGWRPLPAGKHHHHPGGGGRVVLPGESQQRRAMRTKGTRQTIMSLPLAAPGRNLRPWPACRQVQGLGAGAAYPRACSTIPDPPKPSPELAILFHQAIALRHTTLGAPIVAAHIPFLSLFFPPSNHHSPGVSQGMRLEPAFDGVCLPDSDAYSPRYSIRAAIGMGQSTWEDCTATLMLQVSCWGWAWLGHLSVLLHTVGVKMESTCSVNCRTAGKLVVGCVPLSEVTGGPTTLHHRRRPSLTPPALPDAYLGPHRCTPLSASAAASRWWALRCCRCSWTPPRGSSPPVAASRTMC